MADGDTITVLMEREQVKVRLVEIDAPEKGQASTRSEREMTGLLGRCWQLGNELDTVTVYPTSDHSGLPNGAVGQRTRLRA